MNSYIYNNYRISIKSYRFIERSVLVNRHRLLYRPGPKAVLMNGHSVQDFYSSIKTVNMNWIIRDVVEDNVSKTYHLIIEDEAPLPDLNVVNHAVLYDDMHRRGSPSMRLLTIRISKTNRDCFIGLGEKVLFRVGKRYFYKFRWLCDYCKKGSKYYGNMFKNGKVSSVSYEIIDEYFKLAGLECLVFNKNNRFLNASVFNSILCGKITNRRDMIRAFFRTQYKVREINVDLYERAYLKFLSHSRMKFYELIDTVTNLNHAMEFVDRLITEDHPYSQEFNLFEDLCLDALRIPDYSVNPRWSFKRMNSEHTKNCKLIIDLISDNLSKEKYYSSNPQFETSPEFLFQVIDDDSILFHESKEMEHCIYYNYGYNIKNGTYLALKVLNPERCTVGIRIDKRNNEIGIDQIRAFRNSLPAEHTREIIKLFVEKNKTGLFNMVVGNPVTRQTPSSAVTLVNVEDYPF